MLEFSGLNLILFFLIRIMVLPKPPKIRILKRLFDDLETYIDYFVNGDAIIESKNANVS